jgi:large subunit ribosomal protein L24
MNIKKGDNVIVLAGNDKGKKAKVLKVLTSSGKVIVEGVSEVLRRRKPRKAGEKGQVITMSHPIDISNVALFCGSCDKAARIGVSMKGDKKDRVCTRCKGSI